MTSRCLVWLSLFGLTGCFDAHASIGEDAAIAEEDAGTDAGPEVPFVRCEPVQIGEGFGEPCFCNGPVALFGDVVYRRSIGIEVYDVADPSEPALVRVVEERASSMGELFVDASSSTLFSVGNFAPGLWIYDVRAPLEPAGIGSVELAGSAVSGALDEGTLVVAANDEDGGVLHVVDVSAPSSPRLERSVPLPGRVGSVALDGRMAAVVVSTGSGASAILLVDVGTGATLATRPSTGGEFGVSIALEDDTLFVSGGERALTVLRREGDALAVAGTLEAGGAFTRGIARDGARLLLGGDRLRVVDVSEPASPRLLGSSAGPLGDIGGLAWRGELAYVSGGNGVAVVSLGCE